MEYELSESEREQLHRFALLQKVSRLILMKWAMTLVAAFVMLSVVFSVYIVWRTSHSGHRYSATTRLLYTPRQVARIDNMSDKQLMSILDRDSLKYKVVSKVRPEEWRVTPLLDLSIEQARRPSNLFILTAKAPTRVGAVAKANAYAESVIAEYVSYRSKDLENWRESLQRRKKSVQDQIAALDAEEGEIKGQTGIIAPVETLAMLNSLLSDQRRNLFELNIQIANEDAKRARIESSIGTNGPLVSAISHYIRGRSDEIAALDAEIATLLEIYTEKNPKVSGKIADRERLVSELTATLAEKGVYVKSSEETGLIAKTAESLEDSVLRLDALRESLVTLKRQIAENESRADALTAAIPAFERISVRRDDLDRTSRSLDEQLDNIAYLETSSGIDLRQIEPAFDASGKNPFRPFNFAVAAGGAGFCVAVAAFWILALELSIGKVRDGHEVAAIDGVSYIGSIPVLGSMSPAEEKEAVDVAALKSVNAGIAKGTILVCALPGAEIPKAYREAMDWTLAMSGRPASWIDLVVGSESDSADGAENIFQVDNHSVVSPAELEMLKATLAMRGEENDIVFLRMPENFRRGGSFFDQLLSACDGVLLFVGAEKTPRVWFTYACARIQASGKSALAVATGVSAAEIRKEMEASK